VSTPLILGAIWIMSGALAIKLLTSWDELPERVAIHFGLDMQPNGWSSKRVFAAAVLLPAVGEAALASWILVSLGSRAELAGLILLVVNLVVLCVFWQVINYNTRGTPFRSRWVLLPLIALFGVVAAVVISQASAHHHP
jgi:predicted Abi (CAAX) family protease